MTNQPYYDELPERLARTLRPKRHWRELATRRVGLLAILAVVLAGLWIYLAWPPSVPENNAHLEDFCSDPEMVFDEAPLPEATEVPSIVYWIDKDTGTHDLYDGSNLKDQTEPNQGYTSAELAGAELIACGTAEWAQQVDVCTYYAPVGKVNVYTVDFMFVVYEAATHERVGEAVVENSREPSPFLEDNESTDAVPDPWGSNAQSADCPMYMEEGSSVLIEPQPDEVDAAIAAVAPAHGEG
jgi:hypothetical protein